MHRARVPVPRHIHHRRPRPRIKRIPRNQPRRHNRASRRRHTRHGRVAAHVPCRVDRAHPVAVARRRAQPAVAEARPVGVPHLRKRGAPRPLAALHPIPRHPHVVGRRRPAQIRSAWRSPPSPSRPVGAVGGVVSRAACVVALAVSRVPAQVPRRIDRPHPIAVAVVLAVSPVSLKLVPLGVPTCANVVHPAPWQRSTRYPVTPTLSVDAVHLRFDLLGARRRSHEASSAPSAPSCRRAGVVALDVRVAAQVPRRIGRTHPVAVVGVRPPARCRQRSSRSASPPARSCCSPPPGNAPPDTPSPPRCPSTPSSSG